MKVPLQSWPVPSGPWERVHADFAAQSTATVSSLWWMRTPSGRRCTSAPDRKSPAELMYGRRLRLPLAGILPPAPPSTARNAAMETAYNKRHGALQRIFIEGERVHARIGPRGEWLPGVVVTREGAVIYRITTSRGSHRVHAKKLRRRDPLPLNFLTDYSPLPSPKKKRNNLRKPDRSSPPLLRPRLPSARGFSEGRGCCGGN